MMPPSAGFDSSAIDITFVYTLKWWVCACVYTINLKWCSYLQIEGGFISTIYWIDNDYAYWILNHVINPKIKFYTHTQMKQSYFNTFLFSFLILFQFMSENWIETNSWKSIQKFFDKIVVKIWNLNGWRENWQFY